MHGTQSGKFDLNERGVALLLGQFDSQPADDERSDGEANAGSHSSANTGASDNDGNVAAECRRRDTAC
jgi:hypothetical protein